MNQKTNYPPVQLCPVCNCPGELAGGKSLATDARCTACGWYYTTTARRAVLQALTRPIPAAR